MSNQDKSKEQLLQEIEELHKRINEYEHAKAQTLSNREKAVSLNQITQYIADNSIDGIAMAQEGKIIFVNNAYCQIFGYSREELIGQNLVLVVAPEDLPLIEERARKRFLGEEVPHRYTFTGMKKDETKLDIEVSTQESFTSNNKPTILAVLKDVTETKRLKEALQESEEFHKSLIASMPDAVIVTDLTGKTLYLSPKALELAGIDNSQDTLGRNGFEFIAPEEHEKAYANLRTIISQGQLRNMELNCLRQDGSRFIIEINASLVKDINGKPKAIISTTRNITQRKQSEVALLESQEMYESLINASPNSVIVTDLEGRIIFASEKTLELLGLESMDEIIGKNSRDFISPDNLERAKRSVQRALQEGISKKIELTFTRKDGSRFIGEVTSSLIKDVEGNPKSFTATTQDITERKRIEEALRESERKYRTLVDSALIGVYRTNIQGEYIYVNPALARMLGFDSQEEMISQNVLNQYSDPSLRNYFIESVKKTGKLDNFEIELITKSGEPKPVLISATLEGEVLSGMILDITGRVQAEMELKENFAKLQKVMEGTIYSIARIVETRDPYTAGHQQRVAALVLALAQEFGLTDNEIKGLHMAAVIHDIGKIYVPSEILSRPTKLTDTEFALIKTHPEVGYEILKTIDFPWNVAEIVFQHHERLNGSGYPRGLKDEDILFEAKILAVADVVEAMSSHRPYRPSRGFKATIKELEINKGILYDEQVVALCKEVFGKRAFKFP